MDKITETIEANIVALTESIADEHFVGKPALLANGLYFQLEKFVKEYIDKVYDTFKDD